MAKRLLSFFLTILMILTLAGGVIASAANEIYYDGAWHTYTGNTFQLKVNGETLNCSVPPIVFHDYSVVPARDVFEHLGATVSWHDPEKRVTVNMGDTVIVLYINSTQAYKNNQVETMPIAPKIINDKTMIPVRYVAESLGFGVSFDSATDTIVITTDGSTGNAENAAPQAPATPEGPATLDSYHGTEADGVFSMQLTLSKEPGDYSDFTLTAPDRIVLDLSDVELGSGVGNSTYTSDIVTAVRFGQHGTVLRVVLDTVAPQAYSVTKSGQTVTVAVGAGNTAAEPNEPENTGSTGSTESTGSDAEETIIEPSRSITIDPGHGGDDPGAVYKDANGKLWRETDINLAVSLRVRDILEREGVRVVMTRTTEETVVRRSRPELANEEKTALFISIHTNSVDGAEKANGIETWGSLETSKPLAGVDDKAFARNVQDALIEKTQATDRGLKDSVNLTVLLYSVMPSVLVEVGFITNENERNNMFSEIYRDKLAEGIAEGILKTFADMGV